MRLFLRGAAWSRLLSAPMAACGALVVTVAGCGGDGGTVDGSLDIELARQRCEQVGRLEFEGTVVSAAEFISSGTFTRDGLTSFEVPAMCRVAMTVSPQNQFEVWLPAQWNERFLGVGTLVDSLMVQNVRAGFAVAGGSSGVSNGDPTWRRDENNEVSAKVLDLMEGWSHRAMHQITVRAKATTNAFYGKAPDYSYLTGCSGPGRQVMSTAQSYPEDYDGIVAAAPALYWSRFIPSSGWIQLSMYQELGKLMESCKLDLVNEAVVQACDGLDGVADGIVGDQRACLFDPRALIGRETGCGTFTAADARVIQATWDGPHHAGSKLWYGLPLGATFSHVYPGVSPLAAQHFRFVTGLDWDPSSSSYDEFAAVFAQGVEQYGMWDASDADLRPFGRAGGKLIMWHGWSDGIIEPEGSVQYYEELVSAVGQSSSGTRRDQIRATQEFARLFMAPGVGHCGPVVAPGAQPTNNPWLGIPNAPEGIDAALQAVMDWVEKGVPPDRLAASNAARGITRPLCPYPSLAKWTGQGDAASEANYVCVQASD
ncbi:tannase/feruloyl esterase family alpha/beta hydrolase [Pseudorhodoferax soli]|nr:tannase/feruloyl esterase family alpha/beta hydrolase [Pseudorhodoferax soli]